MTVPGTGYGNTVPLRVGSGTRDINSDPDSPNKCGSGTLANMTMVPDRPVTSSFANINANIIGVFFSEDVAGFDGTGTLFSYAAVFLRMILNSRRYSYILKKQSLS